MKRPLQGRYNKEREDGKKNREPRFPEERYNTVRERDREREKRERNIDVKVEMNSVKIMIFEE